MEPGSYVVLNVSDTGMGMDEKVRNHLFAPFFTTKEQGKGTGLGLVTVFGIVKTAGGYVSVYSEPGRGTIFRVYLPRVQESVADPVKPLPQGDTTGHETVLVVEDHVEVRELTSAILRSRGYLVLRRPTAWKRSGCASLMAGRSTCWSPTSSCRG
ncbi:MAG: hypothetical protein HY858_15495 [Candidatus Solibacter usitatus]|nr:hypothetical protein [Candidatus Solibacter usitatus]